MTGSQVITSFYVFSRHESLTQTDFMDCVLTRELMLILKMKTSTGQLTGVPCTLIPLDWSWPGLKRDEGTDVDEQSTCCVG